MSFHHPFKFCDAGYGAHVEAQLFFVFSWQHSPEK